MCWICELNLPTTIWLKHIWLHTKPSVYKTNFSDSRNGFNFENLENALNGFSCSPDDVVFSIILDMVINRVV